MCWVPLRNFWFTASTFDCLNSVVDGYAEEREQREKEQIGSASAALSFSLFSASPATPRLKRNMFDQGSIVKSILELHFKLQTLLLCMGTYISIPVYPFFKKLVR